MHGGLGGIPKRGSPSLRKDTLQERPTLLHGIAQFFGLTNGTSRAYLFWSGIGSDLGELAIIGGLVQLYRQHNCREHRCPRLGLHTYADADGQIHPVCRLHHPLMGKGHHIHFAEMHRKKERQWPTTRA